MCLPFCHRYETRGIQHIYQYDEFGGCGPTTYMLRVCTKCGKTTRKWVWGSWTLEEIIGKKEEKSAPGA